MAPVDPADWADLTAHCQLPVIRSNNPGIATYETFAVEDLARHPRYAVLLITRISQYTRGIGGSDKQHGAITHTIGYSSAACPCCSPSCPGAAHRG